MKVAFQKWGNSLALRVPKVVAQEIGASDGKTAEMSVRDGKLVIEVTKPKRRKRRYTLDELVASISLLYSTSAKYKLRCLGFDRSRLVNHERLSRLNGCGSGA